MDMTPVDTHTARPVQITTALPIEAPLSAAEMIIGAICALLFIPLLAVRVLTHVCGRQITLAGHAFKACAEELARARRA
jgi:hypothetical protein